MMDVRRRSVVGHRSPHAAILYVPRPTSSRPDAFRRSLMSSVDPDSASPAISRGQNAVIVLPHDWASIAEFLAPLIERIDADAADVQLLVATADADVAANVIAASARLIGERPIRVLAATSAPRATRLARIRPPHVVAGTPTTLVDLVRASALKLADLNTICIAWADELVARDESASLETLMAEVPKTAARTIVASVVTPAVEELVERYARRARREVARVPEGREPIALEYVLGSPATRAVTLRRLLDEIDPGSALIFAREAESRAVGRRSASLPRLRRRRRSSLRRGRRSGNGAGRPVRLAGDPRRASRGRRRRGAAHRAHSAAPAGKPSRALAQWHAQAASPARGRRGVAGARRERARATPCAARIGNRIARTLVPRAAARRIRRRRSRGGGTQASRAGAFGRASPRRPRRNVRRRVSVRLMRLPPERTPAPWSACSPASARERTCAPRT